MNCHLPASCDQVNEPCQDDSRARRDREKAQEREDHNDRKAEDGYTTLRALAEEFGRTTFDSQTVETACRAVRVRVSGGKDGCYHQGVDDVCLHVSPVLRRSKFASRSSDTYVGIH